MLQLFAPQRSVCLFNGLNYTGDTAPLTENRAPDRLQGVLNEC